ncbi:hypothetical protein HY642_02580 [Candidatus Woesearchaeota archaeon]|nr:hypothetical protein [Candidatus Woesearchaeota archaeon]
MNDFQHKRFTKDGNTLFVMLGEYYTDLQKKKLMMHIDRLVTGIAEQQIISKAEPDRFDELYKDVSDRYLRQLHSMVWKHFCKTGKVLEPYIITYQTLYPTR